MDAIPVMLGIAAAIILSVIITYLWVGKERADYLLLTADTKKEREAYLDLKRRYHQALEDQQAASWAAIQVYVGKESTRQRVVVAGETENGSAKPKAQISSGDSKPDDN